MARRLPPAPALATLLAAATALGPGVGRAQPADAGAQGAGAFDPPTRDAREKRDTRDTGGTRVKEVKLTDLGASSDITLRGLIDQGEVGFGIPPHWRLDEEPEFRLRLTRSSVLLPDISLLTVSLDDKPIATVRLDGPAEQAWERVIRIPLPAKAPGFHVLRFKGYHRSHLPCEYDDHPGLWSRVLADSTLRITYHRVAPDLNLADWPYPFRDERDMDPRPLVLVVRPNPTADEVTALGYITSVLATSARWRATDAIVHTGSLSSAPPGNAIVFTRTDVGDLLGDVIGVMDRGGDDGKELAASIRGKGWPGTGILALGPRGDGSTDVVLGVAGRDGKGLVDLAILLSSRDGRALPSGIMQRIDEVKRPQPMEPRRWKDTLPPEPKVTLKEIGFRDVTTRGYRGGVVTIPVRMIPDERVEFGKGRIDLVYSYAAQIDPERSRLDIQVNEVAIGGSALKELNGQGRATVSLELPPNELGPDSKIYAVFNLIPRTQVCLGINQVASWATVHSDSSLTVPRERSLLAPDLGLLRHGGFPFGIGPDFANTRVLLPRVPKLPDLQAFVWWAGELGRVGRGDRFAYRVGLGAGEIAGDEDLLVLDTGVDASVLRETQLYDKLTFAPLEDKNVKVAFPTNLAATYLPDPESAFFEALVLQGSLHDRNALAAYAPRPDVMFRVGTCVKGMLVDNLHGRVARAGTCPELAEIAGTVDARITGKQPPTTAGAAARTRGLWTGVIALMVTIVFGSAGYWLYRRRKASKEAGGGGAGH